VRDESTIYLTVCAISCINIAYMYRFLKSVSETHDSDSDSHCASSGSNSWYGLYWLHAHPSSDAHIFSNTDRHANVNIYAHDILNSNADTHSHGNAYTYPNTQTPGNSHSYTISNSHSSAGRNS